MKLKVILSKIIAVSLIFTILFCASGCNPTTENNAKQIDIDLTKMSETMVYSQVTNMLNNPDEYIGKTVKAKGPCSVYTSSNTGKTYYSVIFKDSTACCNQYIEFVLEENNYPKNGDNIEIVGVFDTYYEGKNLYCQLSSAQLITP